MNARSESLTHFIITPTKSENTASLSPSPSDSTHQWCVFDMPQLLHRDEKGFKGFTYRIHPAESTPPRAPPPRSPPPPQSSSSLPSSSLALSLESELEKESSRGCLGGAHLFEATPPAPPTRRICGRVGADFIALLCSAVSPHHPEADCIICCGGGAPAFMVGAAFVGAAFVGEAMAL